jgi:hypothetical protein
MLVSVLASVLALATLACGKSEDQAGCDAGVVQLCSWNAATRACDQACHMVCASALLAYGDRATRGCEWDEATQTYSRDCVFLHCEGAPNPTCPAPADGGSLPTPYFSNDPRYGIGGACAPAPDAAAD